MPFILKILFKYLINHKHYETVLDDHNDYYDYLKKEKGVLIAFSTLLLELLILIPVNIKNTLYWGGIMFTNYFKVAVRNIFKSKLFSSINIFGLAIGICCCFLIGLWVQTELKHNTLMPEADRVYTLYEKQTYSGGREFFTSSTPGPLAQGLKDEMPEVEKTATLLFLYGIPLSKDEIKIEQNNLLFTQRDFFDIYGIQFLRGEKEDQLNSPSSIVLTESIAKKYFGNSDALGKTIKYYGSKELKITGIIADPPKTNSLKYSVILPFKYTEELLGFKQDKWVNNWPGTVVRLKENVNISDFQSKVKDYIKTKNEGSAVELFAETPQNLYLYGLHNRGGISTYLIIFSIIAGIVLLIACINFINLSTARSSKRAKEIGLRKVVGVTKGQIVRQFLGESFFAVILSAVIGFLFTILVLPYFNQLANKTIQINEIFSLQFFVIALIMITITGILSGLYPAFYISAFQPGEVLKGNIKSGKKSVWFRKALVTVQFTISISLIVLTIMISRQISHINNLDLGYNKENLIAVNMMGAEAVKNYPSFRNTIMQNPDVVAVTSSNRMMMYDGNSTNSMDWDGKGKDEQFLINYNFADAFFLETFQVQLVEGRNFKQEYTKGSQENTEFIVNEKAAEKMGMDEPVGKRLEWGQRKGVIIGVMKDFNFSDLRDDIKPLVTLSDYSSTSQIYIRISNTDIQKTIQHIEDRWNVLNPEMPFTYEFMDSRLGSLYKAEEKISDIINSFSILAIIIACLGLVGMVSYSAEQRTREVGIRKVLGASVTVIFRLFSKDFIKWILLGGLIATPLSYYLSNMWLENYKYKIAIEAEVFIIAILVTTFISISAISFQLIKAANANPVDSLRSE